MKLRELIKEEKEVSLVGMMIDNVLITNRTRDTIWMADFDANNRNLTTLIGAPKETEYDFDVSNNKLKSLIGAPRKVGKDFWCDGNKLTSLEYAPSEIGRDFWCTDNPLTNFKDIHKIITKMNGVFYCRSMPIVSHVLGFILIPGLKRLSAGVDWAVIVNKHINKGRAGLIDCQNELIEAGLEEYAQL